MEIKNMGLVTKILIGAIAALHLFIMWFEMFAWTTVGRKVFKVIPPELFEPTKVLAANQGLYNGFLVAGLVWSLLIQDSIWSRNVAFFFLACVVVAGSYGAATASYRIFFVQALPAIIVIALMLLFK